MISDLLYPVVLFHLAVLLFPFAQFFVSGNWQRYLAQTLGVLLPVYALVFAAIYAAQSRHGESWRSLVEGVLTPIPILGAGRRCLALARLAAALEALLSAGVTIIEAWELAAAASGSPLLRRTVLAWRGSLNAGQTPAEVLRASGQFPDLFASQYSSGEISGKLDEVLRRLHGYYQDEGTRKLHAVAMWTPRAFYLAVALIIAYRVVSFYIGYFNQLQNVIGP
jgi:type IV pilus assembly protein PilC